MNAKLTSALAVAGLAFATQAAAEITFYEHENFNGRTLTSERQIYDMRRSGLNDRASSVVVDDGRWEICENERFGGRCIVLRPGSYPSLSAMGMNDRITSVRPVTRDMRVEDNRYAPAPVPAYAYRRRSDERLYEADVTSVRAVVGQAQERCWVEREQVGGDRDRNVGGAILGGIIGGVLGHQVGGGRGQDAATVVGALGGAAIGSQAGRDGGGYSQDVRKCATVSGSARPEYYDVTYNFRGQEHRMQTSAPPGPTVTVNARGEPRG